MARRNSDGKFILSAGEVGSFTVCPEAWRLQTILRKRKANSKSSEDGIELHATWARGHEEVIFLTQGFRIVMALILISLLWFHLR